MGRDEVCARPHIELKEGGVGFEKVGELVLRGEDGPLWRERDVGHVVEPNGVVEDELMVTLAPVVADGVVGVDDQCVDTNGLEARGGGEAGLSGT